MKHANIAALFSQNTKVLTINEVSLVARCSRSHILRLIHKDKLPCFRVGTQYRVLKSDVVKCFTPTAGKTAGEKVAKAKISERPPLYDL